MKQVKGGWSISYVFNCVGESIKLNGKWNEFAVNNVSVQGNNSKITLNLKAGEICRERERDRAVIIIFQINVIAPGFY